MTLFSQNFRLKLNQTLPKEHKPIDNPDFTEEAESYEPNFENQLSEKISLKDKNLHLESYLLSEWKYGNQWQKCLDSPLICHMDAALTLKKTYDAVVGIRSAGVYYSYILKMAGFPVYFVNYSIYKKKMEEPKISKLTLKKLKEYKSVLIVDVDFITGKTITGVYNFLRQNDVNADGAYFGLSKWIGREEDDFEFRLGGNTVDFDCFWNKCNIGLSAIVSDEPYTTKTIPDDLMLYTPNRRLVNNETAFNNACERIFNYISNQKFND
jgi:adenine/guanine phosphoribosyltransferase-like PRPP-binding protein